METDNWYQSKNSKVPEEVSTRTIRLKIKEVLALIKQQKQQWEDMFKNWPLGITPSFISYEELFPDYLPVIEKKIYSYLGVKSQGWESSSCLKQSDFISYKDTLKNFRVF